LRKEKLIGKIKDEESAGIKMTENGMQDTNKEGRGKETLCRSKAIC
jgi:hypothetical protein